MTYRLAVLLSLTLAACSGDTAGNSSTNHETPDATSPDSGDPNVADMAQDAAATDARADAGADVQPDDGVPLQTGTLVETADGPVQGATEGGLRVFKGIPFAQPPIGDRRFRAPQPNEPWSEALDATEYGPACIQDPVVPGGELSEDCLTLNVWAHTDEDPRPVMVWIHGGGYINGSGSDTYYAGANLAANGDVVVVTINYRLGALGYLALPELRAEDPNDSVGNWGALDQVRALQWIQTNAPAFGGDPANITIFGESAGGFSVCQLVGSPLADDLFARAIVQSGGCNSALPLEDAEFGPAAYESGTLFAESVGCSDAADVLSCLRDIEADEFAIDALTLGSLLEADLGFTPAIDGYFLEELPYDRIVSGRAPDRAMILGSNGNEGALFTSQDVVLTRFDLEAKFEDLGLDDTAVAVLMDAYDAFTFPLPKAAWDAFFGELFFNCNAYHTALAAPFPTFAYHLMVGPATLSTLAGPLHVADVPYVLGNFAAFGIVPSLVDLDMRERVQAAWSTFAYTGVPEHDPEWPAATLASPQFLQWRLIHSVEDTFRGGRCDALREAGLIP